MSGDSGMELDLTRDEHGSLSRARPGLVTRQDVVSTTGAEITMLAAKNEYIEARLDQAVEIIMLAYGMGRADRERLGAIRDMNPKRVREDLERLLFPTNGKWLPPGLKWWHSPAELAFFRLALDIVNLPRILASASSGVVQGTKREVG